MEKYYNYIIFIVLLLIALIVGILIGNQIPQEKSAVVCPLCETCDVCEDAKTITNVIEKCADEKIVINNELTYEPEKTISQTDLKNEIRKQLSDVNDLRTLSIKTTTRSCYNWIESESNKGNLESSEIPFCWKKNGRVDHTVLSITDKNQGCQMATILGC